MDQDFLDRGNVRNALRVAERELSRMEREIPLPWSERSKAKADKLRFDIALLEDGDNGIDFPGALRVAQPYLDAQRRADRAAMAEAVGIDADRTDAALPN